MLERFVSPVPPPQTQCSCELPDQGHATGTSDRAGYFCYETKSQLSNFVFYFFLEIQTINIVL